MLVFSKQLLVFLATPKTASTAIEQALGSLATISVSSPKPLKHTDATLFAQHFKPYLNLALGAEFSSAALIRQPRDWLGSWYRNRQRADEDPGTSTKDVSFEQFVRLACAPSPPDFARVGSQKQFLCPKPELRVDHIFRYDRLDLFVHFLEEKLNFEIVLPRLNVSPPRALTLSPEAEILIETVFAEDFDLYRSIESVG